MKGDKRTAFLGITIWMGINCTSVIKSSFVFRTFLFVCPLIQKVMTSGGFWDILQNMPFA